MGRNVEGVDKDGWIRRGWIWSGWMGSGWVEMGVPGVGGCRGVDTEWV